MIRAELPERVIAIECFSHIMEVPRIPILRRAVEKANIKGEK
jgi:hypothetical protein